MLPAVERSGETAGLPWRGDGSQGRPDLPLPPGPMPIVHDRRPRKSWRYVGVYTPEVLLCAGSVSFGGLPQGFYAVWDRERGILRERTIFRPGQVAVHDEVRFAGRRARAALALTPAGDAVEVVSPHGESWIWTRKQGARAQGTVDIDGRTLEVDGPALIDDSAGYHARVTRWSWSAGAGTDTEGRAVLWNLVEGVHDAPRCSERTVWVDGVATEVGPVRFESLDAVHGADGETLVFAQEAERARHDRLIVMDSAYRQPFGTFTGTLPGGVRLAQGYGVMERHDVRW
jgi:hypothetical protein